MNFFIYKTFTISFSLREGGKEEGANTEIESVQLKIWLQAIREREQSMRSRDLDSNTETIVYDFKTHALFVKIFL